MRCALLHGFGRHRYHAIGFVAVEHHHLERRKRRARIAVAEHGDGAKQVIGNLDVLAAEPARVGKRAAEQAHHLVFGKGLQHEHLASREQSPVHLERWIFGRGADEGDGAFFDKGQERVLLRLVEPMDFVDKHDGALPRARFEIGPFHDFADFLDAARHGREVDEHGAGLPRDDAGERGFAHARRAPEDHRLHLVRLDDAPEHLALPDKVLLACNLVERFRAHARSERRRGVYGFLDGVIFLFEQQLHEFTSA